MTDIQATSQHHVEAGKAGAPTRSGRAAKQRVHERFGDRQMCGHYWPERVSVELEARFVGATEIGCQAQPLVKVSGEGRVPPIGLRASVQMRVLITAKHLSPRPALPHTPE